MDEFSFPLYVADRLGNLPGVTAVTLGGSRAEGTQRPDSDWDFSLYYRGRFDPQALRDIGWPGEVLEAGGWGVAVLMAGLAVRESVTLAGQAERAQVARAFVGGVLTLPAGMRKATADCSSSQGSRRGGDGGGAEGRQ